MLDAVEAAGGRAIIAFLTEQARAEAGGIARRDGAPRRNVKLAGHLTFRGVVSSDD
jgi:hypothetical protein